MSRLRVSNGARQSLTPVASIWTLLYEVLESSDTYLAFLPLAHILEFVVEMGLSFAGMPIGYGRVKTLTDASVRECKGDIAEFKPVRRADVLVRRS